MKPYTTPDWLSQRYGIFFIAKRTQTPDILKTLSKYTTFWKVWNTAGTLLLIFLMIASSLLIGVFTAIAFFPVPHTIFTRPSNLILIPGMGNSIQAATALPYVLTSFILGIAFHELGHGIAALSEGYEIEEWGILFLTVLPIGAYIKTNTTELNNTSDLFAFHRFMSAGIINNFFLGMIGHAIFKLTTTATIESTYLYYFGSLLNYQPTLMTSSINPIATFGFWLFVVNINLAILNALPIFMLDGGRVINNATLQATHTLPWMKKRTSMALLIAIDALIGLGLILIIFKPTLF